MMASIKSAAPAEKRGAWLRQPFNDRPLYNCPQCGEVAMQFFRTLPASSKSEKLDNAFECCACGQKWEMRSPSSRPR